MWCVGKKNSLGYFGLFTNFGVVLLVMEVVSLTIPI